MTLSKSVVYFPVAYGTLDRLARDEHSDCGQNHNPSILNPDFLWRNHIVPEEITLADNVPLISTPMASQCVFKGGFRIVSEPNKIGFTQTDREQGNPVCYDVAKRYLRIVPLVHYTAVGINFAGFFPTLDSKFAPHNMLRDQGQNKFEDVLPSAEVILTYPLAGRTVNVTIKNDIIAGHESEQKVVIRGNFHRDIQADQNESHKVAIAIAEDWENDLECFKCLAENIAKDMREQ